ncbi:MAG: hypothetical protein EA411_12295 [Saprospirales bacterium]|nr:MAG: hypothetical protein EA411_12295 [Saprospirales bacterium]
MKIDRDNYEQFAIDFLEGTLPKEQREAFEEFLAQNPDIAEEMEDLQQAVLKLEMAGETPVFSRKESLYQTPPTIGLLHRPVQLKLWQAAAVVLLLIASIWVSISLHLETQDPVVVALNEAPVDDSESKTDQFFEVQLKEVDILPEERGATQTEDAVRIAKSEKLTGEKTTYREEDEFVNEGTIAIGSLSEDDAAEENGAAESKPEKELREEIADAEWLVVDFDEMVKPSKNEIASEQRNPVEAIDRLPSRLLKSKPLATDREWLVAKTPVVDFSRLNSEILEDRESNGIIARFIDRVTPRGFGDFFDPGNLPLDPESIPDSFLPEYAKK